jgi:hypothetical protein
MGHRMDSTTVVVTTSWPRTSVDIDRLLAELRRRFPRVVVWWGEYTHKWWALPHDRASRLIEAADAAEMGRRLSGIGPPPSRWPIPPDSPRSSTPESKPPPTDRARGGRHERPRRRGFWRRLTRR